MKNHGFWDTLNVERPFLEFSPTGAAPALMSSRVSRLASALVLRSEAGTEGSSHGYDATAAPSSFSSRKDCGHTRERRDCHESQDGGAYDGRPSGQPAQSRNQSVPQVREEAEGVPRFARANLVPEHECVDYCRYLFDYVPSRGSGGFYVGVRVGNEHLEGAGKSM